MKGALLPAVAMLACLLAACAGARRHSVPPPDAAPPANHHRAAFLRGLRICLDPGHGGDVGEFFDRTGYKRGPTGLREADANLRTARELAVLLRGAGAEVLLTRDADTSVSLEERARLANEWPADILVSIHHNASSSPATNFSSVWYHGDGAGSPASLDLARALSDGLARGLRLDPRPSGIYSDVLVYASGFAVLRHGRVPAVLAECSFFTNPSEEERLRDPAYNARVAACLFDGLCDWAANGVPRWRLKAVRDADVVAVLSDGMKEGWGSDRLRIREDSVRVLLDGRPVAGWRLEGFELFVPRPAPGGGRTLDVRFQNRAGNSSVTPAQDLAPPGA